MLGEIGIVWISLRLALYFGLISIVGFCYLFLKRKKLMWWHVLLVILLFFSLMPTAFIVMRRI
jgi:hypothetical protein